jgi:hypothetical protein
VSGPEVGHSNSYYSVYMSGTRMSEAEMLRVVDLAEPAGRNIARRFAHCILDLCNFHEKQENPDLAPSK